MIPKVAGKLLPILLFIQFFMPFQLLADIGVGPRNEVPQEGITSNFQGWNRKQAIIIDHERVAGSSDLVDFPFLVTLDHLASEVVDGGVNSALNGGGDLRFSSDANGNNRLAIEVVEFVTSALPGNRKCQIWVKLPVLSAVSNPTIYVWYNKLGAVQPVPIDPYGSRAVWSNYYFVSHNGLFDSATGQSLTVAGSPTVGITPYGGMSWKGNGITDYTYMADGGIDLSSNVSVSIWKKNTVPTDNFGHAFALGNATGWMTLKSYGSTENIAAMTFFSSALQSQSSGEGARIQPSGYQLGWHYFSVSETTVVGQGELMRADGIPATLPPTTGHSWPRPAQSGLIMMGNVLGENRLLEGELSEFRVSLSIISPEFSDTDYNNMVSPMTFAYPGVPVDTEDPDIGDPEGGKWVRNGADIYYENGNVGIGTTDPGEWKMAVNGKIRAKELKVEIANWPDYVFDRNYVLPTLIEVEKHIKDKGHLINVPSAGEIKANGLEVGAMNRLLLEKIEELTLYLLQQEERIKRLENNSLKN